MNLRHFLKNTWLGRWIMVPCRLVFVASPHGFSQMVRMLRWAFISKEHYNHTYHLTPLNLQYLASAISMVSGVETEAIGNYIEEIVQDGGFYEELKRRAAMGPDRHNSDAEPRFGRRLGWYALVRATKPRIVMETGVDRGLGTALLARALEKNAREGYAGRVFATDINPDCGYLITDECQNFTKILLGDSIELLKDFKEPVDIFIHDSDHRPEYEWAEFLAIEPRLHADSIVMSDNSLQSPKCLEFARRLGKSFLYFQDQPKDHWWPGDGIGVAFTPGKKTVFQSQAAPAKSGREERP